MSTNKAEADEQTVMIQKLKAAVEMLPVELNVSVVFTFFTLKIVQFQFWAHKMFVKNKISKANSDFPKLIAKSKFFFVHRQRLKIVFG